MTHLDIFTCQNQSLLRLVLEYRHLAIARFNVNTDTRRKLCDFLSTHVCVV